MKYTIRFFTLLSVLSGLVLVHAESEKEGEKPGAAKAKKKSIIVASKTNTEGALLGQIIVLMLNKRGFAVKDSTEYGGTDAVRNAIQSGKIDIYPEYTGNGSLFFDNTDPSVWKDRRKGYETVKRLDRRQNGIIWLEPANANNSWNIAIRKNISENRGIRTFADFSRYLNKGGKIKLAGSDEFVCRPDALPAFEEAYGFKFTRKQLLVFSDINKVFAEMSAAKGSRGINGITAYGAKGNLISPGLVVLQDTLGVQAVYMPAPIIRQDVLKRYPKIPELLNPVFRSLDLITLRKLNSRIVTKGLLASQVAHDYLESKGFL